MARADPQALRGAPGRWWSLVVVALAVFMATVDAGLLTIALPVILTQFKADLSLAGWVAMIYALVTGSLYLPCGRLADLTGRKKIFVAGFFLYAAASFVAGWSQNGAQLLALRALQAAGAAVLMANTFALMAALFPPHERGRAMGIAGGTVSALGYTLGPVLGGLLTHSLGWRSIFYVTAGLGCAGFVAAKLLLPDDDRLVDRRSVLKTFDLTGALSFAVGMSAWLLALAGGQQGRWHSTAAVQAAVGSASLIFFVRWERRTPAPLLDLGLFQVRSFVAGNLARAISFITISMNTLVMPFFLQLVIGFHPLHSGLLIAPTPLGLAVLAPLTGWLSERFSPRLLCAAGLIVKATAFAWLSLLDRDVTAADIAVRLGLLGMGLGIFQTPNNAALMSSIPRERLGVGSSFLSIVRSFGHSAGAALATTIVAAHLVAATGSASLEALRSATGPELDSDALAAFINGLRFTYVLAAALCAVGALVCWWIRDPGHVGGLRS